MYLAHFGLLEPPFSLTPDTAFFVNHAGHQEALNMLLVALRSGEGFIKVTGEVGTGKTLLCRKLMSTLDPRGTAYIHNPYLKPEDVLEAVCTEFGIPASPKGGRHAQLSHLANSLIERYVAGVQHVLCLDEVQAMPAATLEVLRLLTNLETEKTKLLQVVLFGQPELDTLLTGQSLRQLCQRISFSYELRPMTRSALSRYVRHRLEVAAQGQPPAMSEAALDALYHGSRGIPRVVNILANKSLMVAYGQGRQFVDRRCVRLAIRDTPPVPGVRHRRGNLGVWLGTGAAGLAAVSVAAYSALMLAG